MPLLSGTTNILHAVYFLMSDQGVAVGDQGLILRTTDGGAMWQSVASGVEDGLRSVFFRGVNGISGGDSQTIFTRLTSEPRGRSGKADSLAAVFQAPTC